MLQAYVIYLSIIISTVIRLTYPKKCKLTLKLSLCWSWSHDWIHCICWETCYIYTVKGWLYWALGCIHDEILSFSYDWFNLPPALDQIMQPNDHEYCIHHLLAVALHFFGFVYQNNLIVIMYNPSKILISIMFGYCTMLKERVIWKAQYYVEKWDGLLKYLSQNWIVLLWL